MRTLIIILLLIANIVFGQTGSIHVDQDMTGHKLLNVGTPTSNGDAANKLYVDTHGGGGGGSVSLTATSPIIVTPSPITGTGVVSLDSTSKTNWDLAFTQTRQWDGGATGLVAATGRTSLGLVIGTNVQAFDADLAALAALTGTNTIYYRSAADTWSPVTIGGNMTFTGGTIDASTTALSTNIVSDAVYDATGWNGDTTHAPSKNAVRDKFESLTVGGNVSNTGTPLDNQVAVWTDATHIEGNSNLSFDASTNILSTVIMSPTTGFRINGAAANRRILVGNATNFVQSTETYAVPGTSGNVMTSDGTNWTSAAPAGGSGTVITTGSPATGNLTKFSGATSITNGDLSGNVTTSGTLATTIANSAVTYAKIQNVSANSVLLGSSASGSGAAPSEIALGTNLSMTGSTLNAAGGGGGGTAPETLTISDATTNVVTSSLFLGHNSSGTPAANFGAGLQLNAKDSTTNDMPVGALQARWKNQVHGSNVSYVSLFAASAGGVSEELRLYNSGGACISNGGCNDPGSGVVNVGTGFQLAGVATAGKILQGNGTSYSASTPTWPTAAGTAGYTVRSNGTNFTSYPQDMINSSTASDTSFSNADRYLIGSNVVVAAGDFQAKGQYRCVFDMTKSAGTGAIVISVRVGTLGTTGDTAVLQFNTFGAGTGVADTGRFEVLVTWRSVGSGTSAVVQGVCTAQHNLATTGLFSNGTSFTSVVTSSGFASNTFTNIGVSFNGNTAFTGTTTLVQASLLQ